MSDFKVGDRVVYGMTIGSVSPRPKGTWGGDMVPLIGEIVAMEGAFAQIRTSAGQVNKHPVESLKPVK